MGSRCIQGRKIIKIYHEIKLCKCNDNNYIWFLKEESYFFKEKTGRVKSISQLCILCNGRGSCGPPR